MAEANIPSKTETEKQENEMTTENCMEQFLQKSRSELMYELRRIQHGERPVTGTDSRDNINQFFSKRLQEPAGAAGKENVPANVDDVEEHRPESVVVEVQGLFEQQRVSSMLQSTMFRRSLERIIRNSLPSPAASNRASPARTTTPPVPSRRMSPLAEARGRADSTTSSSSASSSATSTTNNSEQPEVQPPQNAGAGRVNGMVAPQANPTWQEITAIHHEEMVTEISNLLHQRIVSSTLEGEFRGTLEVQMQNRLATTEADGEQVASFVRNLPSNAHLRNDFSNLGLAPPADNWDNISVTSVSATAVPYTQSNLHLSREMRSLKSQMEEMKNMLKLTFDLQLDIQRAIRQEVAAAVATATAPQGASAAATSRKSVPVDDTHCLICLEGAADSVLYQCGHMCLCFACGKHLVSRGGKCPVCRAPIRDIIRAYKCSDE